MLNSPVVISNMRLPTFHPGHHSKKKIFQINKKTNPVYQQQRLINEYNEGNHPL